MKKHSKKTICIHEGQLSCEFAGTNTPIYTSTSYAYLDNDERLYPRYFNIPNQKVLIEKIAKLENAESGLIFGSGMAAISTSLLNLLSKGDHAVFQKGLYGGTINFILTELKRFGIEYTMLENNGADAIRKAIQKNTRLIYIETPSNPLLSIVDLKLISTICKEHNILSLIDNTFASPINQNPVDFGIDVVIHSATKYLGGHSDISAGVVVSRKKIIDKLYKSCINLGGSLNALMCHLLERSIKTLSIRVLQQNQNAQKIAEWLSERKEISNVYYPGLKNHPGHEIAKSQMSGFGGVLSFELKNTNAFDFQKRLKLIKPSMSLGGVETIICSPAETSHRHMSTEQRLADGISNALLRLAVGIEDSNDLINDLEQAF